MVLLIKAYNFLVGMLIGLLIVYWVKRWDGGCRYVEVTANEDPKMD